MVLAYLKQNTSTDPSLTVTFHVPNGNVLNGSVFYIYICTRERRRYFISPFYYPSLLLDSFFFYVGLPVWTVLNIIRSVWESVRARKLKIGIKNAFFSLPEFPKLKSGNRTLFWPALPPDIGPFKIGNRHLFHYRYKIRYHNAVLPTLLKNA